MAIRIVLFAFLAVASFFIPVSGLYKGGVKIGNIYVINLYQYAFGGDIVLPFFLLLHLLALAIFSFLLARYIKRIKNYTG
jgi:hypothetical protein